MARPPRIDPPDGWHHVMNRGVNHGRIFFGDGDRVEFGRLLGLVSERHGVEIHAYCLMDNHFHLLVRCPGGNLSDAMHLLGSLFVRFVNDRCDRDGPLFKGRFHALLVTNVSYLANVVRYIHLNPLDIVGVHDPVDYRWCSHRTYLRQRLAPTWLSTEYVDAWFDHDPDALEAFVLAPRRFGSKIDPTIDAGHVIGACEFIVAERSTARLVSRAAEVRSLALTLVAADPRLASTLHTSLELDGGALRTAQSRARTALRRNRSLPPMLDAARRLLTA